jgi:3-mercaptopyruvate sulfurtransferase SseA
VYALGHIPGAILLPLEGQLTWPAEYEKTAAMLVKTKRPVVTYCA